MSIFDWRPGREELFRPAAHVDRELKDAVVVGLNEYGSAVRLRLKDGTEVWYGCSGWEFDVELNPVRD